MNRAATMEMAVAERTDLAEYLATLTPQQWEEPSLCAGWRVRDVVAHAISYDGLTWFDVLKRAARAGFRPAAINDLGVAESRARTNGDLLARLRDNLRPTGPLTVMGGMIPLVDALIHHQDIRRPLGHPRDIPPERLRAALRLSLRAPPIGAGTRAAGLRVVATDLDWSRGDGPVVEGPGEALLMALAGRPTSVAELSGDGVKTLVARL
ncbi:maleylpyruvate isomerase family mycothiol-dependent enzyme [Saccharopolyspora tripterygii]